MVNPIAFIPARGGSVRVKDKNVRPLLGVPLIVYTIEGAKNAGIFGEHIYVTSDSQKILSIAESCGVHTIRRPEQFAHPNSYDWEWIKHALETLGFTEGIYFILRPTNPFRTSRTILRAWREWDPWFDSLRATYPTKEPAQKQWIRNGDKITPLLPGTKYGQLYCDLPTQVLIKCETQTGCLQIAKIETCIKYQNPTGRNTKGFLVDRYEKHNIDDEEDWEKAEWLAESRKVELEPVRWGYEEKRKKTREAPSLRRKKKNGT